MMRILFITGEFPPMQGGVGDCTNEIAQALAALGVDVHVLTSMLAVGGQPSVVVVTSSIKTWGWFSLRTVATLCQEFQPHIVHIQYQTGAYGMHPAINFLPRSFHYLRRGRVRVVTTFHDLRVPYLFPKARFVREWATRVLAQSCDAVIATNDEDYLRLETWNPKLLHLIPIGSNISTTEPPHYQRSAWRAQLGIAENETLLCYFGFLSASKGGETLMRALALIPNAKLLMIGGQTGGSDPTNVAYVAQVQALIAELGLTERVLWTDHVAQEIVTAHFYAADICVMPYRDGASYRRGTLMAALAHGMPLVTTVGSGQWAVGRKILPPLRDSENCLLVPPENPQAIATAVQRLGSSPDRRAKIGAGARELAQHFTWDKIAQQHLDLYERIANRA